MGNGTNESLMKGRAILQFKYKVRTCMVYIRHPFTPFKVNLII
ncbi:hypothetical protein EC2871950_3276 [Escherichia coli 2871950]|nr:hypothetical protein EC2871950_3276 [Escherichia coli 2871950]